MSTNHCPGPTTPEGKAISSRNALNHGCTSETLILPHENRADFDALQAAFETSWNPRDDAEKQLLKNYIEAEWFRRRAAHACSSAEARLYAEVPDPFDWDESHHRKLTRFHRYLTTHTNLAAKHRRALEEYRRVNNAEAQAVERLQLAHKRLAIYAEKNKPEPAFEETFAAMRQQAQELGFISKDENELTNN